MIEAVGRITKLSHHDQTQVRSTVLITSLTDVILGLVKNSLDARAHNIVIVLDFVRGYCSVLDDGVGIVRDEFVEGRLAKLYYTSKTDDTDYHGRYGRFLASLSAVSLTTITSTHERSGSTNTVVLKNGLQIATSLDCPRIEEPGYEKSGTKVVVHNLFGNVPVRAKYYLSRFTNQMESDKEFYVMKRQLVALTLASRIPLNWRMKELTHGRKFEHKSMRETAPISRQNELDPESIKSTLIQAGFVDPDVQDWHTVSAQNNDYLIRAAICPILSPKKDIQFISIGQKPIGYEYLYNEINALFDASRFTVPSKGETGMSQHTHKVTELQRLSAHHVLHHSSNTMRRINRWPVFYVNIEIGNNTVACDTSISEGSLGITQQMREMNMLLKNLITEFLGSSGLVERDARRRERRREPQVQRDKSDPGASQASGNAFIAWSKTKAAQPSLQEDLLSGLPFNHMVTISDDKSASTLSTCSNSCVIRSASTDLDVPEETRFVSSSVGTLDMDSVDGANAHGCSLIDDTTLWTDSHTGFTSYLNSRTGMIMPRGVHHNTNASSRCRFPRGESLRLDFSSIKDTTARLSDCGMFKVPSECVISSLIEDPSSTPRARHHKTQVAAERPPGSTTDFHGINPICSLETLNSRIAKDGLDKAKVVGQVDSKYILTLLPTSREDKEPSLDDVDLLVAIDQHAADERIKVEELYSQLCDCRSEMLSPPMRFSVLIGEAELFRSRQEYFAHWGILFDIESDCGNSPDIWVRVTAIPAIMAERCRMEPKILLELLRKEVWSSNDSRQWPTSTNHWLSRISSCPQGMLEMIHSRACRSAIMFNDVLSVGQCKSLVRQLGKCLFPFQCAHGRPTMKVLTTMVGPNAGGHNIERAVPTFAQRYREWLDR